MSAKSSGNWRFWLVGLCAVALLVYMVADASGAFTVADPAKEFVRALPGAPAG